MKTDDLGPFPPGWDSKFDPRTGHYYFINHYTKSTSWEDPRVRYQQIGKPTSLGSVSSKENKFPPPLHDASSSSPKPGSSAATGHNPHDIPAQDPTNTSPNVSQQVQGASGTTSLPYPSASPLPLARLQNEDTPKASTSKDNGGDADAESSFIDPDLPVKNIAAMFPTVDENHIRTLLKKYHGSQAVVISALQVAKHPFITPGPASGLHGTPPPSNRHSTLPGVASGVLAGLTMTGSLPHYYNSNGTPLMGMKDCSMYSSGYPTPRPGSAASGFDSSLLCMGSPQIGGSGGGTLFKSFPRPHSSPKMKLRYLKSVFPTVEEYLLLDVLSNSDNNVQKAADRLVKMGYVKRDTPSAPRLHARKKEEERLAEKRTPLPKPPPIKSDDEKSQLRKKMVETYEVKYDIPERILYMALESVLYDEDQANNLINSMIEDDLKRKKAKEAADRAKEKIKKKSPKPNRKSLEISTPSSPKKDLKKVDKKSSGVRNGSSLDDLLKDSSMITRGTSTQEDGHGRAKGPNPAICKGPNDGLLLKDYVTWNGPDPGHSKGANLALVSGPNPDINLGSRSCMAKGHQESLARGPRGHNRGGTAYKSTLTPENETTRSS